MPPITRSETQASKDELRKPKENWLLRMRRRMEYLPEDEVAAYRISRGIKGRKGGLREVMRRKKIAAVSP